MTPELWQRIEQVFHAALERRGAERARFLKESCGEDRALREEVESLLLNSESFDDPIDFPIRAMAAGLVEDARPKRVGPYRVTGIIGQGGMGAVYRAVRDDRAFEREVAIKMVHLGMLSPAILERFCHEREILAALDHPNIARLLDGGATDEEIPYIVMESVSGVPITGYVTQHGLSIPERLRLFQQVCSAVQYAHQMLVVHRDIKPANILVTANGIAKLLDFGVAKLLDPSGSPSATRGTSPAMMTPEYASPEQVIGEPVSTSSDVYSLGVVLYEILTGRRPYGISSHSAVEVARAVCETAPAPMGVSGDLDNIVLMALRKEAQRRYANVQQLSDDIERALTDQPVRARADTVGYRVGKFVRRNRLALTAGVVLIAALAGATAVSVFQARRSERRFNEVRELANVFLLKFDDSIRDLPGSTKARELLVSTALQYLRRLSAEASGDVDLTAELASAYEKVGDVQGSPAMPNLGRTSDALESWELSRGLWDRVLARRPSDARALRSEANVIIKAADLRMTLNPAGNLDSYKIATALAERAFAAAPDEEETVYAVARIWFFVGECGRRHTNCSLDSIGGYERSLELYRKGGERWPSDRWRQAVAITLGVIAVGKTAQGDPLGAAELTEQALVIRRNLAARHRESVQFQRGLANTLHLLGNRYGAPHLVSLGDRKKAEQVYREALEMSRRATAADPADETIKADIAVQFNSLAEVVVYRDPKEAESFSRSSLKVVDSMQAGAVRKDMRRERAEAHTILARAALARKDAKFALQLVDSAIVIFRTDQATSDLTHAELLRDDILQALGRSNEARAGWTSIQQRLTAVPLGDRGTSGLRDLGEAQRRLGISCTELRSEWARRKITVDWPVERCK